VQGAFEQLPLVELVAEDLERWRPVPDAPAYEVSSHGRVRRGGFAVASWPNAAGYRCVSLEVHGQPRLRYVHRLVLAAFRGTSPARPIANHLSGCKSENTVTNLEWTTAAGNARHARTAERLLGADRRRAQCQHGHPREQPYTQGGRRYLRCARCRRAAYRRKCAFEAGQRSFLSLLA